MQVFHHEDQWTYGCQHLQSFSQLPQHAVRCHTAHSACQGLPVCWSEQRRHLYKPAWGILPQERHEVVRLRSPTEARQGFQDWQVGFPSAIMVDALAMTDPDIFRCGQMRDKLSTRAVLPTPGSPAINPI